MATRFFSGKIFGMVNVWSNASLIYSPLLNSSKLWWLKLYKPKIFKTYFTFLCQQAYEEFLKIQDICINAAVTMESGGIDEWAYIWGSNQFSVSKAYKALIGIKDTPPHFTWIWKSSCQQKHKFFFRLLLHDRLNTRDLLQRKIFNLQSYSCATLECDTQEILPTCFGNVNLHKIAGTIYAPKEWITWPLWRQSMYHN